MNRVTLVAIVIVGLFFFLVIARLHDHFAEHAAQVAAAQAEDQQRRTETQEADRERVAHEERLAWQRAHPVEYARQEAQARADARRLEQQHIAQERKALAAAVAAKATEQRKEQEAASAQSASEEAEQSEVSADIPSSALVQSFTISNSSLALVIDRDVWDAMSRQDRKLFCGQVNPIWSSIFAKHHAGSTEDTNVMLFDLNGELVTSVGACWVW